jgi:NitT/TauT family transport system ATP-binding protein
MADVNALEIDIGRKAFARRNGRDGAGADELVVLEDLRVSVPEGAFTCIVGPSGCGKTTLLNIVSGLDPEFRGAVRVDGLPPAAAPPPGYMFQSPRLMPWLSVRENVHLVQRQDGGGDGKSLADRLLHEMGLGGFLDAYPGSLSGGMKRRVALARAFVTRPRLLLLDEPFLSLDAPVANRLRGLLLEIWRQRPTTVLFVTHDLREALYMADRVLFMSASPGRIVLDLPIALPRPRVPEGQEIEMLRLRLLEQHPELLAGLAVAGEDVLEEDDR